MLKKLICIFLVVLMLVPSLVACNDDPGVTPPDDTKPGTPGIDETNRIKLMVDGVSQYTLIRTDAAKSDTELKLMQRINRAVKAATGVEMAMDSDWDKKDLTKYEILVGNTNRPESTEILSSLGKYNFGIKVIGNKIVINANNEYSLTAGVEYFITEFIEKNGSMSEGYLSLPESIDYIEADPGLVVLAEGKAAKYALIYTKDWGDTFNYTYYDYTLDEKSVVEDLASKLKGDFGVSFNRSTDVVYNAETLDTAPEILIGRCDRTQTETAKSALAYNEYAIKVDGSKIIVAGHGFNSTYEAILKFTDILGEFKVTENGVSKLILPANFNYVGVYENGEDWIFNVPQYQGGKYDSASDLGMDLDAYVLKYKETNLDEYNAYLAALESAGYTKYVTNEIDGNLFATYTKEKSATVRVQFAPVYSQTTIVVEPSNVILPPLESENTSAAVTTPKLVQLKISNEESENGQCHIFRLNNGKFIVFDGGGEANSADLIYDKLVELNVLDGKPIIAAWIFTHYHGDHFGTFISRFAGTYKSKVKIENYMISIPSETYLKEEGKNLKAWTTFKNAIKGGNMITPHAGDVWYFGDMKMTCLFTQVERLPDTFEFYNDSSLVFMFEIGGQKILITGDASENVCGNLVDMYPTYLKADILQFPHHGHYGATRPFVNAVDPWCVLIPASKERWQNKLKLNTYSGSVTLRYLLAKKTVKEYYVHGVWIQHRQGFREGRLHL